MNRFYLGGTIALLLVFQLASLPPQAKYLSFSPLSWLESENCKVDGYQAVDKDSRVRGTFVHTGVNGFCESHSFTLESNIFGLEYFGVPRGQEHIEILDDSANVIHSLQIPAPDFDPHKDLDLASWQYKWHPVYIELPEGDVGAQLKLRFLRQSKANDDFFVLRE